MILGLLINGTTGIEPDNVGMGSTIAADLSSLRVRFLQSWRSVEFAGLLETATYGHWLRADNRSVHEFTDTR